MKDEIKEIIELINTKYKDYYIDDFLSDEDIKKLIDYITNLQDTLKDREEYCYGLETQLTNLQEENKRLSIELNKNMIERNNYLSRNEKAIEKIQSVRIFGLRSGKTLIATLLNEVLDILQGSDKDE